MSNRWLFNVAIFAVGAAVGAAATCKYFKTKYERFAEDEIREIRNAYLERIGTPEEDNAPSEENDYKKMYNDIVGGYIEVDKPDKKPYVIAPDDVGNCDYDLITLTYYADGILADERDEPVKDVDGVVGKDSLTTFGQYEDDCVFVRNDARLLDYEILLDTRNFFDVVNTNPRFVEGE